MTDQTKMIGERFGLLTIVRVAREITPSEGVRRWFAYSDCACGKKDHRSKLNSLTSGETKSCGCGAGAKSKHGESFSPEYCAWAAMIQRCTNPKYKGWKNYGGRGIIVCERWMNDFIDFLADVGYRPSSRHSLDRYPNNNGNYEPGNVRWATRPQQNRNSRSNKLITIGGRTLCIQDWVNETGIPSPTLRYRLRQGMKPEDAIKKVSLREKGQDGRWITKICPNGN